MDLDKIATEEAKSALTRNQFSLKRLKVVEIQIQVLSNKNSPITREEQQSPGEKFLMKNQKGLVIKTDYLDMATREKEEATA